MKIDQLPVEVLREIFSYLPSFRKILMVNKLFYGVACELDSIGLRITRKHFDNAIEYPYSIHTSKRKIVKLNISGSTDDVMVVNRKFTLHIVERFSTTIKSYNFTDVEMDEATFVEILSLVPNLEDLVLVSLRWQSKRSLTEESPCEGDLNLKKLKKLSINSSREFFATLLYRLPVGVLSELQINDFNWHALTAFLSHQLNIKILKLSGGTDGTNVATHIFDKLKLESLQLSRLDSITVAAILAKQVKLKTFIFDEENRDERAVTEAIDYRESEHKGTICQQVMRTVANNSELETFGLDITETSASSLVELQKLKKLKDLTLVCRRDEDNAITAKFRVLASLDFSSINKLTLSGYINIPVDLVDVLAKAVPHLKYLMVITRLTQNQLINAVMKNFTSVEVLKFNVFDKLCLTKDEYNPNLRELLIQSRYGHSDGFIEKLFSTYPNLVKLTIDYGTQSTVRIKSILDGFTKLKTLFMKASELIVEDLNCLYDRKKNLKLVCLEGLTKETVIDLAKFKANFEAVLYVNGTCMMAVSHITIGCEYQRHVLDWLQMI